MLKPIKEHFDHFIALLREKLLRKWVGALWLLVGFYLPFRDEAWMPEDDKKWKIGNLIHAISFETWLFISLAILVLWLFEASFSLSKEQTEKIRSLDKFDSKDLERLMYGFFYGNTFIYKAEMTICKQYNWRFELLQIRNIFQDILIHAPKNSRANIQIEFFNSRQAGNGKCYFYYLDTRNKEIPVSDIYIEQEIYLNDEASFQFKFVSDDSYIINDDASLRINIRSWTK